MPERVIKKMATDIQQTPFIKQLAANGIYSFDDPSFAPIQRPVVLNYSLAWSFSIQDLIPSLLSR